MGPRMSSRAVLFSPAWIRQLASTTSLQSTGWKTGYGRLWAGLGRMTLRGALAGVP